MIPQCQVPSPPYFWSRLSQCSGRILGWSLQPPSGRAASLFAITGFVNPPCVFLTRRLHRSLRWKWPGPRSVPERLAGILVVLSKTTWWVNDSHLLCWPLTTQRIDSFTCQVHADKGQLSGEWLCFKPLYTDLFLHPMWMSKCFWTSMIKTAIVKKFSSSKIYFFQGC